jgi:hypothetical protein
LCEIAKSRFERSSDSSIVCRESECLVDDIHVSQAEGNGIWATHKSVLIVRKSTFQDSIYPAIGLGDGSNCTIEDVTIKNLKWSGIVVRDNSIACVVGTTISETQNFGIFASLARVKVTRTTITDCAKGLLLAIDHAEVIVSSSVLEGRSECPVQVLTGACVDMTGTKVTGSGTLVSIRLGGSVEFKGVEFTTDTPDTVVANESSRPVRIENCPVRDRDPLNQGEHLESEKAKPGRGAREPKCVCCGETANCIFSECPHIQYCRNCWDGLETKPEHCPLCHVNVKGVVQMFDCGTDRLCQICRAETSDGMVRPCWHLMCSACGDAWFAEHTECPFCRREAAYFRPFVSYG